MDRNQNFQASSEDFVFSCSSASRKRKATDDICFKNPKSRKILSTVSDIEFLLNLASATPTIKCEPINSLKAVMDKIKTTHHEWLDNVTKNYENYIHEKLLEVEAYAAECESLYRIRHELLLKSIRNKVQDLSQLTQKNYMSKNN